MERQPFSYFVHPEHGDVIKVKWDEGKWSGKAMKFSEGPYSFHDSEIFRTSLQELLKNNWIMTQVPPTA